MSLRQRDVNWDSSSGAAASFTLTVPANRANGPYCVLFHSFARGQNAPINGTLIAPQGKFRLVGRKYKPEISATLELWAGWDVAGTSAAGTLSFRMDYDGSYSGAAIGVITLTGAAQGDEFVSQPIWSYVTDTQRVTHKTSNKPAVCRTPEDDPNIAQYGIHARLDAQPLTVANAATDFTDQLFLGAISLATFHNGTIDQAGLGLAPELIETFVSSSAAFAVSVNVFGPQVFDGKEGTSPEDEFSPEEEMRLKERITELERDLTTTREQQAIDQADFVESNRALTAERDSHKAAAETSRAAVEQALGETARVIKQNKALQQQVDAIPQLVAERDATIAQLTDALNLAAEQHAALQQELDAVRAELQQTLAALPAHIEQAGAQLAQQQISALLADPDALRNLLMQQAQTAPDPRTLFSTLQGLQQIG